MGATMELFAVRKDGGNVLIEDETQLLDRVEIVRVGQDDLQRVVFVVMAA
jgi:hypothetical protein